MGPFGSTAAAKAASSQGSAICGGTFTLTCMDLTTLPDEILTQVLLWLDARQLAASALSARFMAQRVRAAAEA